MKILCCNPDGGAFLFITKGWANAFKTLGHEFRNWKGTEQELKTYKPDIYLGCSGWRQVYPNWARKEYGTKIGIHVNPWGTTVLKALPHEPNINESQEAIKWVNDQKPDFVYGYATETQMSTMWNFWSEKQGYTVVPMPTAGDAVIYKPVPEDAKFKCDLGFIGGYWPYKSMNINLYLMPVINRLNNVQVHGWGGWNHIKNKYKGSINDTDVNKLFSSAKVCPSICEPHTIRYGIDIPERMWKVPLGGGFTICDPALNLKNLVDDSFPIAKNPKEYSDLIDYYINHQSERLTLKAKQRKWILNNHTYFHRIANLFLKLKMTDEFNKTMEYINNVVVQ